MYYTKEQPTTGSFTKVWVHKGDTFSRDYKFIHGVLYTYDIEDDDWVTAPTVDTLGEHITDIVYITPNKPKFTEMV